MGDYHSNHSKLYHHLEAHLYDDMSMEKEAARLEVTVDELYTTHTRRDLDAL